MHRLNSVLARRCLTLVTHDTLPEGVAVLGVEVKAPAISDDKTIFYAKTYSDNSGSLMPAEFHINDEEKEDVTGIDFLRVYQTSLGVQEGPPICASGLGELFLLGLLNAKEGIDTAPDRHDQFSTVLFASKEASSPICNIKISAAYCEEVNGLDKSVIRVVRGVSVNGVTRERIVDEAAVTYNSISGLYDAKTATALSACENKDMDAPNFHGEGKFTQKNISDASPVAKRMLGEHGLGGRGQSEVLAAMVCALKKPIDDCATIAPYINSK